MDYIEKKDFTDVVSILKLFDTTLNTTNDLKSNIEAKKMDGFAIVDCDHETQTSEKLTI